MIVGECVVVRGSLIHGFKLLGSGFGGWSRGRL